MSNPKNNKHIDSQIFSEEIVDDPVENIEMYLDPEEAIYVPENVEDSSKKSSFSGAIHTLEKIEQRNNTSPTITSGDLDADWEQGDSTGEESSLSSVETPDQSNLDEITEPWGLDYELDEELNTGKHIAKLEKERGEDELNN